MLSLIRLFKYYRVFLLFFFLELIALGLFLRGRSYVAGQGIDQLHELRAQLYLFRFGLQRHLHLDYENEQLLAENLSLRKSIRLIDHRSTAMNPQLESLPHDSLYSYDLIVARVIHNGYTGTHNFITINKGARDGIRPEMGLLAPGGIVGRVKYVSEHFSTAYSLLDTDLLTSALWGKGGILCSLRWGAKGPRHAYLEYLPRHASPSKGDTIYTSGYDGMYPFGLPIAVIDAASIEPHQAFYVIDLRLLADFYALHHVYVLRLHMKKERDSLEEKMNMSQNL